MLLRLKLDLSSLDKDALAVLEGSGFFGNTDVKLRQDLFFAKLLADFK